MTKELVDIEFFYDGPWGKTVTIGIFDTLEEAVSAGNKALDALPKGFKPNDRFEVRGSLGIPTRLVVKTGCPRGISFFAHITKLEFSDVGETIDKINSIIDKKKVVRE